MKEYNCVLTGHIVLIGSHRCEECGIHIHEYIPVSEYMPELGKKCIGCGVYKE